MEKMREEFEAWVVSALGCDVADTSKDEHGVYNSLQTGNLYVAWIASRKALCVELPAIKNDSHQYNQALHDVSGLLQLAGVNYK